MSSEERLTADVVVPSLLHPCLGRRPPRGEQQAAARLFRPQLTVETGEHQAYADHSNLNAIDVSAGTTRRRHNSNK